MPHPSKLLTPTARLDTQTQREFAAYVEGVRERFYVHLIVAGSQAPEILWRLMYWAHQTGIAMATYIEPDTPLAEQYRLLVQEPEDTENDETG